MKYTRNALNNDVEQLNSNYSAKYSYIAGFKSKLIKNNSPASCDLAREF